jgi:DHA2 family multidrug resistance protein
MRNLGGAIGIALIDTVLYGRTAVHAEDFRLRLLDGDTTAAQAIGLSMDLFVNRPAGPPDAQAVAYVRPMVEKASRQRGLGPARLRGAGGLLLVPLARDRQR